MRPYFLIIFMILLYLQNYAQYRTGHEWFTEESLSTTVLLEKKTVNGYVTHGTGFLIYPYSSKETILISCEHVLRNNNIYVVLPLTNDFLMAIKDLESKVIDGVKTELLNANIIWNERESFIRVKVDLIEGVNFEKHPDSLDIAGFKVALKSKVLIKNVPVELYDAKLIPRSFIQQEQRVKLGDDCYFVGFPFGIGTNSDRFKLYTSDSPKHLVRKATVSWISNEHSEFLLDGFSYGGNSGGPLFKVGWEPKKPSYYLIGIVIGHLGSKENFGLARVLKADQILEVINMLDK